MEEHEIQAAVEGGEAGREYLQSIGITDIRLLNKAQWATFLACVCRAYHLKHIELSGRQAVR